MSGGHTPGPWRLSDETLRDDLPSRLVHGPGIMLAIVRTGTQAGSIGDANARLIAAAPELLEALEALEYQLGGETDAVKRRFADPRQRARDAIAKARGAS